MQKLLSRLQVGVLHAFRDVAERFGEIRRPEISWTLRLTIAATAAYLAALALLDHNPLLAPLSALLVTQVTVFSVVRQGIDRVVSVVAGVSIAILFSSMVGLTWWSLAATIAVALLIGQLLRLGDNLVEVPVTAMFVLAVGAETATAGLDRVYATLVGAVVGLAINVLLPPGVRQNNAGYEIEEYGKRLAQHLENVASQLPAGVTSEQASAWLLHSRNLTYTSRIDALIERAEESRRLNVRALNKVDISRALYQGLWALEHCAVAVRSIFRGINDVIHYPDEDVDDIYPEAARQITADVLNDIASALRAFGALIDAQAGNSFQAEEEQLIVALTKLNETRVRAAARLRESDDSPAVHELNVFVVATIGRVQRELDLRGHTWLNDRRIPYADERLRAAYAAKRLQAITRQFAGLNRRRPRTPR